MSSHEQPSNALRDRGDPQENTLRDANENLVLAALKAAEQADEERTARLEAEKASGQFKVAADELRATAEGRERLIAIIGHDLRVPLNAMTIAAALMGARGGLNEADQQLATRIVESGGRVARMITQLTDFTQARLAGGFTLCCKAADLGQICQSVAEELRVGADVEIHESSEGDLRGTWDADRLADLLSNLAGNAVRYASQGTPVLIDAHATEHTVTAEVTNYGPSIPPALLLVLFEPFRRASGDQPDRAGHLGLGLYIASEIARSHGGSLSVRSAQGTTTFTLSLPRAAPLATGLGII
jgi:signal transduction histidine kinase